MMDNKPLVSVLMTSYNRQQFIAEAIESVLDSTYSNFELIIVDDCSTDDTVAIAQADQEKDKRVQIFVNEENIGDYPNRNKAASYARGKYLKYVDSDDTITVDGLERMVQAMEAFPAAAFGISHFIAVEGAVYPQLLLPAAAYQQHYTGHEIFTYGPIGAIIRKDIFDRVNGFNPQRYISDTDFWLKLSSAYPIVKMAPGLVIWRQHPLQEYKYGNDSFSYLGLTYAMDMKYLSSSNCPLGTNEVKKIKTRLQWKHARDILRLAFINKKFKLAYDIFITSGLSFAQLLYGLKYHKNAQKTFSEI